MHRIHENEVTNSRKRNIEDRELYNLQPITDHAHALNVFSSLCHGGRLNVSEELFLGHTGHEGLYGICSIMMAPVSSERSRQETY